MILIHYEPVRGLPLLKFILALCPWEAVMVKKSPILMCSEDGLTIKDLLALPYPETRLTSTIPLQLRSKISFHPSCDCTKTHQ